MHEVATKVVPIVVRSLGVLTAMLSDFLKDLGVLDVLGGLQTSANVGTTIILQKVLSR